MVIKVCFTVDDLREIISRLYREEELNNLEYKVELPAHSYEHLIRELKKQISPLINVDMPEENITDFKFSIIQVPGLGKIHLTKGTKLVIELKEGIW